MTDPTPEAPSDPVLSTKIQKQLDDAVEAKVAGYRNYVKGFLAGLAVLVSLLLGGSFITRQNLIRGIHGYIFPVESAVDQVLAANVAISYSNSFWLGTQADDEPEHQIPFYADTAQDVKAFLEVIHQATGARLAVTVQLAGASGLIWSDTLNRSSDKPLLVSKSLRQHFHDDFEDRSDNIHLLVFTVSDGGEETQDRVFVRSLITVSDRERGPL